MLSCTPKFDGLQPLSDVVSGGFAAPFGDRGIKRRCGRLLFGEEAMSDYARPYADERDGGNDRGGSGQSGREAGSWMGLMGDVVTRAVLPRLRHALSRKPASASPERAAARLAVPKVRSSDGRTIQFRDVERLVALVVQGGPGAARVLVDGLMASGVSRAAIFNDLLAPAARLLGDNWLEDKCSFTDVTIGVGHLQTMLRDMSLPPKDDPRRQGTSSILLTPWPNEQHSLGLAIVEECFRSSGWRVLAPVMPSMEDISGFLAVTRIDVLGLSLSSDADIPNVSASLRRLRQVSLNPALIVLMGGGPFIHNPALVFEVGADDMAVDGPDAVMRAQELLAKLRRPR